MAGSPGSATSPVTVPGNASRQGPSVLDELFADPAAFSFPQVVRILYHAYGEGRGIPNFVRESLRIRPHLSLGFPPSDVVALERLPAAKGRPCFLLTLSMLGLYGASSPMPTFYTEELLREEGEDRSALRAFFDLVNGGFFAQYLQAGWFRYQMLLAVIEGQHKGFAEYFLALAGLSDPVQHARFRRRFAVPIMISPLSQFPRSAVGLESFLSGCLKVPVRVEQCVPRRAPVPQDQQCCLGRRHLLGESAVLGSETTDRAGKIAVHIGPMDRKTFATFTPGGKNNELFTKLLLFYVSEPLSCDISCTLAVAQREKNKGLPGSVILGEAPYGSLGRDSWLALPEHLPGTACFPE